MVRPYLTRAFLLRPVMVVVALLISLDLFLVGLALLNRPLPVELTRVLGVEQQADSLRSKVGWARDQWRQTGEDLNRRTGGVR